MKNGAVFVRVILTALVRTSTLGNPKMKLHLFSFYCAFAVIAAFFAGCATAPKTVTITGQILVTDNGAIQKTGLAPIWIYDATNTNLTAQVPLPKFGGRSRQDLQRIARECPGAVEICSNYWAAMNRAPKAEIAYNQLNGQYQNQKAALHGTTNGPAYDVVLQLGAQVEAAWQIKTQAWDDADDINEFIFYWFNVNPGMLYATRPQPLAVVQADKDGNFSFTLPLKKTVLVAAHIQGKINGQTGQYFWLLPVSATDAKNGPVVLNAGNARLRRKNSQLKPTQILVLTDSGNGGISISIPNRVRDVRSRIPILNY